MRTKIMPVSDLRRETSAVIQGIQRDRDVVYITQHGRPTAVLMDYEEYEALLARAQQTGWPPNYFQQTYGALADDPLTRTEQGEYEEREVVQ
jgi:prevent-host-death family protein